MDSKQKTNWVDLIVCMMAYGLSAFVFIYSATFKKPVDDSLGPAMWPRILCVLLCIAATVQLVNVLRGKITSKVVVENKKEVFLACVLIILYGILLKSVGYIICTIILSFCFLKIFRVRKWPVLILIPLLTALISFYLFDSLLRVPLPAGLLQFILE